jgi:hypothetical protein
MPVSLELGGTLGAVTPAVVAYPVGVTPRIARYAIRSLDVIVTQHL